MMMIRERGKEWLHKKEMKHETRETYITTTRETKRHEPFEHSDPPSKQNFPSITPNFLKCCSCQTPTTLGGIAVTIQKNLFWRWSRAGPVDNLLLGGTWVTWTRNCSAVREDIKKNKRNNGNQWFKEIIEDKDLLMAQKYEDYRRCMSHRHARTQTKERTP
jgi:hypothetical protein